MSGSRAPRPANFELAAIPSYNNRVVTWQALRAVAEAAGVLSTQAIEADRLVTHEPIFVWASTPPALTKVTKRSSKI